jgi:hypothetical protein
MAFQFKSDDGISIPAFATALEQAGTAKPLNPHPEVAKEFVILAHELSVHHQTIRDCARPYHRRNCEVIAAQDLIRAFQRIPCAKAIAVAFADKERGEISIAELEFVRKKAVSEIRAPTPAMKPEQVPTAIDHVVRRSVEIRSAFEAQDELRRRKLPSGLFRMIVSTFSGIQMIPKDVRLSRISMV